MEDNIADGLIGTPGTPLQFVYDPVPALGLQGISPDLHHPIIYGAVPRVLLPVSDPACRLATMADSGIQRVTKFCAALPSDCRAKSRTTHYTNSSTGHFADT